MARQTVSQSGRRNYYVRGDLAYDYDRLEREQRSRERAEQERRLEAERLEREAYVQRRREAEQNAARRTRAAEKPIHRERQHVSLAAVAGVLVLAVMAVSLLMSYARLTGISSEIVGKQKELSSLQEEHVALVTQYEKTFDLAAIKAAAEAAGMAKPSSSQVYYVDLSEADNVVIYQQEEPNVLTRVFTAMGNNFGTVVEYFK